MNTNSISTSRTHISSDLPTCCTDSFPHTTPHTELLPCWFLKGPGRLGSGAGEGELLLNWNMVSRLTILCYQIINRKAYKAVIKKKKNYMQSLQTEKLFQRIYEMRIIISASLSNIITGGKGEERRLTAGKRGSTICITTCQKVCKAPEISELVWRNSHFIKTLYLSVPNFSYIIGVAF